MGARDIPSEECIKCVKNNYALFWPHYLVKQKGNMK